MSTHPDLAALLELCELHYCPQEQADAKAEAFLTAHGWTLYTGSTEGKFGHKAECRWWCKGNQMLWRSQALWQEGREVLERAKGGGQ